MRAARVLLAALGVGLGPGCPAEPARNVRAEALVVKVRRLDATALRDARELGARAVQALLPLATSDDARIRELAVSCLGQVGGGPEAEQALAAGLSDPDREVRLASARGLGVHPSRAALEGTLAAVTRAPDAVSRRNAALLYGAAEGASALALRPACRAPSDEELRLGCTLALAQLGDRDAQHAFAALLVAARGDAQERLLNEAARFRGNWLARAVLPLLADESPLTYVGVDGLDAAPSHLRACDRAVNEAARAAGLHLSFPVSGRTSYTDAQLAEVKREIDRLGP